METTLTNLDRQQQIQFTVVTVDSTNGQEITDYGLAVARGFTLAMGGDIMIEDTPGGGTTVIVSLAST